MAETRSLEERVAALETLVATIAKSVEDGRNEHSRGLADISRQIREAESGRQPNVGNYIAAATFLALLVAGMWAIYRTDRDALAEQSIARSAAIQAQAEARANAIEAQFETDRNTHAASIESLSHVLEVQVSTFKEAIREMREQLDTGLQREMRTLDADIFNRLSERVDALRDRRGVELDSIREQFAELRGRVSKGFDERFSQADADRELGDVSARIERVEARLSARVDDGDARLDRLEAAYFRPAPALP